MLIMVMDNLPSWKARGYTTVVFPLVSNNMTYMRRSMLNIWWGRYL